jgi:nitrogen fixation protein
MKLEDLTIQQCHLGKKFIVLLPDIPCDAILPDGRIADKYQVKLPPDLLKEIKLGDNQYINDAAYNDVHADFNVDLRKPVVIQRNRDFWGGW